MKSYQVRFADEALDDLGRIFIDLLPVAGERVARNFVGRLEAACLNLTMFPARGSLRNHVRSGLRIVGYRHQASIAFTIQDDTVTILRIFGRGQDVETELGG